MIEKSYRKFSESLWLKKKVKFVIVSPRQHHGGPIVLHLLCKLLAEKGYDARIFYTERTYYTNFIRYWTSYIFAFCGDIKKCFLAKLSNGKELDNRYYGYSYQTVRGCKRKITPFITKNTIVVYPEIVHGNILRAKNVVRWFLSYNRYPSDEKAFGAKDLMIDYRKIFNDPKLNPKGNVVTISYFDFETYRKYIPDENRSGMCYIIRKGARFRNDIPNHFDGPIIDDWSEKRKVMEFNKKKYCVFYDTQTGYTTLAAMCGCIPVIIPETGKTRCDYRTPEDNIDGVAFGFSKEEIDFAIRTRDKLLEKLKH